MKVIVKDGLIIGDTNPIKHVDPLGIQLEKLGIKENDDTPARNYVHIRTLKISENYKKNIKKSKLNVFEKIKDCNKDLKFFHLGCPNGHVHKYRPFDTCDNHYCLWCAGRKGRKNGAKIFDRLISLPRNPYFMYFVFTIPDRFWDLFFDHNMIDRWRVVCRKTLNEFFHGYIGGVEREHTWGDSNFFNIIRNEPHLNYIVPSIRFVDNRNKAELIDVWQTKEDLDRLRKVYLDNLRSEFGISKEEISEINVYYSYKKNSDRIGLLHICKYIARVPLELPLRDSVKEIQLYGKTKQSEVFDAVIRHLEYYEDHRSIRWFGWLSSGVFKKYLVKIGLDKIQIDNVMSNMKRKPNTCPVCGEKYVVYAVYLNNTLVKFYDKNPPVFNQYFCKLSFSTNNYDENFVDIIRNPDMVPISSRRGS